MTLAYMGLCRFFLFFFNDTATTEIYTLSLHDALPIRQPASLSNALPRHDHHEYGPGPSDRKSTRLNSSPVKTTYAVYCLKKKKITLSKICRCICQAIWIIHQMHTAQT